jgi:hypothetical protein
MFIITAISKSADNLLKTWTARSWNVPISIFGVVSDLKLYKRTN